MPTTLDVEELLSVPRLTEIPTVRGFERRVRQLGESTEILQNAFEGALEQLRAAGRSVTSVLPGWELTRIRWDSFVSDVRNFVRDAVRWFRTSARDAVDYFNGLVIELDEWLGFSAMWSELREWILRELRAFRGGRTLRERLDRTEEAAGRTFTIVVVTALAGLGLWVAWEWQQRRAQAQALQRLATTFDDRGDDDDSFF